MNNVYLIAAGILSFLASILHIAVIFGGPSWYRFFGAGEKMVNMAAQRMVFPTIITSLIALILFIWGCFAFSAAGILPELPFMKVCLVLITSIYLVRGAAGFIMPLMPNHPYTIEVGVTFWVWSSVICLSIGLIHMVGLIKIWSTL